MAVDGIKLLGGFEVALGREGVARLPTRKAQALLAYLAMPAGGRIGREDAAALLWGDADASSARNNLRQTLFVLRKALGPAARVLDTDATTLSLTADVVVDVAEFERDIVRKEPEALAAAITRYRGDFLSSFAVDEPAFEDWVIGHRERLRALMRDGLARLVAHDAHHGNLPRALETARRGLALDPLDEAMHRELMRLHAAAGHPVAALRQYQVCVDALQRELSVEPAAETRALYRKLLAQRQTGGREESIPTLTSDTSLVGRDLELAQLTKALEEASRAHGRVVAILGEAGIGKSRLARELAAEAERRGARVVIGGCHDAEQTLPLHPWVEAVRRGGILEGVDVSAWPTGWRSEISRLFPEIDPMHAPDPPRENSALHLFEGLARLIIGAAATRPLVAVVEDLHWADTMSVRFLSFLANRIERVPVLVAVTARDEDAVDVPVLGRVLAGLEHERRLRRFLLTPLTRAATDQLVRIRTRHAMTDAALAPLQEAVWAASNGNAFVTVEMVQAFHHGAERGATPLPRKVHELIADRLDRLGARAQELAALAAVMTGDIDFSLLARASGAPESAAAEGLEELVRRRVLHAVGDRFAFVHDRVRDVALHRLLPPRRRLLHRQVAEAAEALYAAEIEAHSAMLALHYRAAQMWERALPHLRRTGLDALAGGAQREAAGCFEQAIDALERLPETADRKTAAIDLRIELRHALVPLGDFAKIGAHLVVAERLARALEDRPRLGRVLAFLGNVHLSRAEYAGAREAYAEAQAIARELRDPALAATLLMFLGILCHQTGDFVTGAEHYRRFLRDANEGIVRERIGVSGLTLIYARTYLCICLSELGEFAEGYAIAEQTVRHADGLRHPWALGHASVAISCLATRQGHPERALATYAWYRDALPPTGDVWPLADAWAAYAQALAGRPADALPRLDPAAAPPSIVPAVQLWRANVCIELGRMHEARAIASDVLETGRGRGENGYVSWALVTLGEIAAKMSARGGEAEERYEAGLAIARECRMRPLEAHCRLGLGRVYERTGRREAAHREQEAARALLTELGMTRWLPRA